MTIRFRPSRPWLSGVAVGVFATGGLLGIRAVLADGIPSANPLYYSGTLSEGGQLVTGTRAITINLWPDGTTQGTPLCQTVTSTAPIVSGRFRIPLVSSCKTAINQNNSAWVEVIDGATSLGRAPIGAVPYAVESDHAVASDSADDAGHAGVADNALNAATASALAPDASGGLSFYENPSSALAGDGGVTCSGTTTVDCTCPAGTYVVAGGGWIAGNGDGALRESRPVSTTTWRTTCETIDLTQTTDALCNAYETLCSRLGP